MSTITIRMTKGLQARVVMAAAQAGTTEHVFILEAITEKICSSESNSVFYEQAQERFDRLIHGGKTIEWCAMRSSLLDRADGLATRGPAARKLTKP